MRILLWMSIPISIASFLFLASIYTGRIDSAAESMRNKAAERDNVN